MTNSGTSHSLLEHVSSFEKTRGSRFGLNPIKSVRNLALSFPVQKPLRAGISTEWNPFSQRPALVDMAKLPRSLASDFDAITSESTAFINFAHECMHVALWEPFFIGKMNCKSRQSFVDISLAFEGFCFWYADIMITPEIRDTFPDGEIVFSRSAASLSTFHPYRAFKALGIKDAGKILKIYVDAFLGKRTVLLNIKNTHYAHGLSDLICNFYFKNKKPAQLFYKTLSKIGMFDSYFEQFCDLENLPSLFPRFITERIFDLDISQYCGRIHANGIPFSEPNQMTKVRMRRMIQSRAYYAFLLRYVLSNGYYLNKISFREPEVLENLEKYLDELRSAIRSLAVGDNLRSIYLNMQRADSFFDRNIWLKFRRSEVWMSKRLMIHPRLETKSALFGRLDPSDLSNKEIDQVLRKLSGQLNSLALGHGSKGLYETIELQRKFLNICELAKSGNGKSKVLKNLNDLVISDWILNEWSVPLYSIRPLKGEFCDILFSYI